MASGPIATGPMATSPIAHTWPLALWSIYGQYMATCPKVNYGHWPYGLYMANMATGPMATCPTVNIWPLALWPLALWPLALRPIYGHWPYGHRPYGLCGPVATSHTTPQTESGREPPSQTNRLCSRCRNVSVPFRLGASAEIPVAGSGWRRGRVSGVGVGCAARVGRVGDTAVALLCLPHQITFPLGGHENRLGP